MSRQQSSPTLAEIIPYEEFCRRRRLRDDARKARTLDMWRTAPVHPSDRRFPRLRLVVDNTRTQ